MRRAGNAGWTGRAESEEKISGYGGGAGSVAGSQTSFVQSGFHISTRVCRFCLKGQKPSIHLNNPQGGF